MKGPTHVLGCDLAGPANAAGTACALCAVRGTGLELVEPRAGLDDADIAAWLTAALPAGASLAVGLDAPLSYQPGGGDRPGDRALRRRLVAAGLAPGTVMAPTMTRMAYLTLRGMAVARLLAALAPACRIAEVHPGGVLVLRGAAAADVRTLKTSAAARRRLLRCLGDAGLTGLPPAADDHAVAAAAAALGALGWARGRPLWREAAMPPLHPFDLVC